MNYPNTMYTVGAAHGGWVHAATDPAGERFRAHVHGEMSKEYRSIAAARAWVTRTHRRWVAERNAEHHAAPRAMMEAPR